MSLDPPIIVDASAPWAPPGSIGRASTGWGPLVRGRSASGGDPRWRGAARIGGSRLRPALIRYHAETGPPGLLAEWLRARGIPFEVSASWMNGTPPDPAGYAFVASLGSRHSPRDGHEPIVAAELALLDRAVARDVPVLGLCFGGQALATVLGGRVEPAPTPELGWRTIETDDPETVPAGPWLEWHYERFVAPPGAVEVARTEAASQAFRIGPHLGVQFHPESTVDIVEGWARHDAERLAERGIADGVALLRASAARREAAARAAFRLFDGFLDGRRERA